MALHTSQNETEGIVILSFDGRLVFGPEASSAQDTITQIVGQGQNQLILDLKKVSFIDSTGLGVLVVAHSVVEKAKGAIRLLHLSERHMQLLVLTKLTTLFELFDDLQTAVDSFFPDRSVKRFDILEFVKSQANEPAPMDDGDEKQTSNS